MWVDFVCPYCYVGIANLLSAIDRLQLNDVQLQFASYLKYPFASSLEGQTLPNILSDKYGISEDEAQLYMDEVASLAKQHGLQMDVQKLLPINTFTAHRLLKLAMQQNVQREFYETLSTAYFLDGVNLEDAQQLQLLSEKVGLAQQQVQRVLQNSALYEDDVEEDLFEAKRLAIKGVPYIRINNSIEMAGIYSVEKFEHVLQHVIHPEQI